MKKHILILFMAMTCQLFGQKAENRIYAVDWTQSMIGYKGRTPNIWEDVKNILIQSIEEIDEDDSSVTLFCFSNKIDTIFHDKSQILSFLKNKKNLPSGLKTNLSLPWRKSLELIQENKYNFITFITDGAKQNVYKETPFHEEILSGSWNNIVENNEAYMCFVQLSQTEMNPLVNTALKQSNNLLVLDQIIFPTIIRLTDTKKQYKLNLVENKKFSFSLPVNIINKQGLTPSLTCQFSPSNNLSDIIKEHKTTLDTDNKQLNLQLYTDLSQEDLDLIPEQISGEFHINSNDQMIVFPNQSLALYLYNKKEKNATVDLNISTKNTSYYPTFWFLPEKIEPLTFSISSKPGKHTNENTPLNYTINLYLKKTNEKIPTSKYITYINKNKVTSDIQTTTLNKTDKIDILLNNQVKSGKYYINIKHESNNLDNIYPQESFDINFKHSTTINPLKKLVIIISIILFSILLLWKLALIYSFYPRINRLNTIICKTKIALTTVKIKGARKVIIINKKGKQNFLNKFFTGKIIYINCNAPITSPIVITPQRNKAYPVKISTSKTSDYTGLRAIAKKGEELTFTNKHKESIIIKFT